jgi:hypothetical protein
VADLAGNIANLAGPVTEFAKMLTGRHGGQLDTSITAVEAANLISKLTDAANEERAAWRNWPPDRIYPVQARSGGRSARLGPPPARRR